MKNFLLPFTGSPRWQLGPLGLLLVLLLLGCRQGSPVVSSPDRPPGEGAVPVASDPGRQLPTYELRQGWWWNGSDFERRRFYSVDGLLTTEPPAQVDEVLDFGDRFLVPPFAEAHNHNLESNFNLERIHRRYLEQGIFYVAIANNINEKTAEIRRWLEAPGRLDVAFANAGITAPGGHPSGIYKRIIKPRAYAEHSDEWLAGRAYFEVETAAEIDRLWPQIVAGKPDFIKVFLLDTKNYERQRNNPEFDGIRGLNPDLLTTVVRHANAQGLRVAAHVETAQDFRFAVAQGVKIIMHLPGYRFSESRSPELFRLTDADAREAAGSGVTVVTTTVLANHYLRQLDHWQRIRQVQAQNLTTLHRQGVAIAVGSDRYELTALDEIMHLRALGVFDSATLLELWCATARGIFPRRKIGKLAEGFEASFLVLDENPLESFNAVKKISYRFKQGMPIDLENPNRSDRLAQ